MKIRHYLSAMVFALALAAFAMPASAGCHYKKGNHMKNMCMSKWCGKMKRCYPGLVRGQCQTVPGHWWNTTWVPTSMACWYLKG